MRNTYLFFVSSRFEGMRGDKNQIFRTLVTPKQSDIFFRICVAFSGEKMDFWNILTCTDSDCDYTPGKKKPFKCSICEATFTTKNTMKTHIDSIHDGKKLNTSRVKCTICEKIFSSSSNIRTHISNKHKDVMIKGG